MDLAAVRSRYIVYFRSSDGCLQFSLCHDTAQAGNSGKSREVRINTVWSMNKTFWTVMHPFRAPQTNTFPEFMQQLELTPHIFVENPRCKLRTSILQKRKKKDRLFLRFTREHLSPPKNRNFSDQSISLHNLETKALSQTSA